VTTPSGRDFPKADPAVDKARGVSHRDDKNELTKQQCRRSLRWNLFHGWRKTTFTSH
jgi:hypothetical protein